MIKDLIEVKQLPVIEEQLKSVSAVIEERVKNATNLVCTEDSLISWSVSLQSHWTAG